MRSGSGGAGLRGLTPLTVSWLRREWQIDELSQAEVGPAPGDQEGCRIPRDKPCAASTPQILLRLAAQLKPQPLDATRWPSTDIVAWLKQVDFREPDHSISLCR